VILRNIPSAGIAAITADPEAFIRLSPRSQIRFFRRENGHGAGKPVISLFMARRLGYINGTSNKDLMAMLEPEQALDLIRTLPPAGRTEEVPLMAATGRVLAESVRSGLDLPPFAKSAMDGYAVASGDPSTQWRVLETVAAGDVPAHLVEHGTCAKIMTGAMMPEGADKVIRVEYTEEADGIMRALQPESRQNIIQRGENLGKGDPVLEPRILKPQDIGVLASVGADRVRVACRPLVGIITTGSELRDPGQQIGPGEIYNSNGWQLYAQVEAAGSQAVYYGNAADRLDELAEAVTKALDACDLVLLSGGVSMGDFDFVPQAVKKCGVEIRFHGLAVKPGKPTLFGQRAEKYLFGVPGNPVATFVIFEVFIKALLYRLMGIDYRPPVVRARLARTIRRKSAKRVAFRPVQVVENEIHLISYHGSSHLNALSRANGLLRIDRGVEVIEEGTPLYVRSL
jgi:molybdopterin molybdotransferase